MKTSESGQRFCIATLDLSWKAKVTRFCISTKFPALSARAADLRPLLKVVKGLDHVGLIGQNEHLNFHLTE